LNGFKPHLSVEEKLMKNSKAEGVNVHNDISKDINRGIKRVPRPSLKLISKWREQWAKSDSVIHMTFDEYKRKMVREWHRERKKKK